MIDDTIERGGLETALQMAWVRLAYNETDDFDAAFSRIMTLHSEEK